ncbi:MAG: Gfo/Idh/MocA family protein [Pirellulales bacterium]
MSYHANRRQFLQTTAVIGAGYWVGAGVQAQESKSPSEKVRIGCIGIGGKGSSDSGDAASKGQVVAVCDVDENTLNGAGNRFKGAKRFTDFRKMLEEMESSLDAVTVSTPDHCHAAAAVMAMRMGKHCFVQKPLAHSLHEARVMAEVAREKKVATQMGNQGTAGNGLREAAALIRAGVLGSVKEVHIWTNRPIWPQGGERPKPAQCPPNLKWDLWLGPAPERPYANGYHPFSWRGWWDFGTGALGDMACHTMNMPFMGLDLRDPVSVVAQTSGHNKDSYPKWSIIDYEFAATDKRPAVTLKWYDGGKRCPKEVLNGKDPSGSGCCVVGDKGKLYSPDDYGGSFELLGDVTKQPVEYPKSPGHFEEWIRAIKGGEPAMSNFPDYAVPLTETVLLGNLAVWADGKKIEWDAKNQVAKNAPEVADIIKPPFRKGYSL